MIPYVVLKKTRRRRVDDLLMQYAKDQETTEGLRVHMVEAGDDFEEIRQVIEVLEPNGYVTPGLWTRLEEAMEGDDHSGIDWRERTMFGWLTREEKAWLDLLLTIEDVRRSGEPSGGSRIASVPLRITGR